MQQGNAGIMAYDIEYSSGPFAETCDVQRTRFQGHDKLFARAEARVPSRFQASASPTILLPTAPIAAMPSAAELVQDDAHS